MSSLQILKSSSWQPKIFVVRTSGAVTISSCCRRPFRVRHRCSSQAPLVAVPLCDAYVCCADGGMENPCLTFVTPTLLAGDRYVIFVQKSLRRDSRTITRTSGSLLRSLANVVAHEIA